jgi:hypothetical protein
MHLSVTPVLLLRPRVHLTLSSSPFSKLISALVASAYVETNSYSNWPINTPYAKEDRKREEGATTKKARAGK